jgi:hypothetical protein
VGLLVCITLHGLKLAAGPVIAYGMIPGRHWTDKDIDLLINIDRNIKRDVLE